MPRTYVKKGPKGSKCFALTLNDVEWTKSFTGWWFQQDEVFQEVAVGEEPYSKPLDPDTGLPSEDDGVPERKHHHVWLLSKEDLRLDDIRTMVLLLVEDKGFDLQICRSKKAWLIYLSKQDAAPFLYNVPVSALSLYARAQNHIKNKYKRPCPVDTADHFMASAGNFRNVCIDMARNHVKKLRTELQAQRTSFEPNMQCGFVRKIYADILLGKHLYIYGAPGVGKTEVIDRIVKERRTFRTNQNDKWMFGSLHEGDEFALFEDFDPFGFTQMPVLLSIMDGKPVSISEKYVNDEVKMFSVKCIFISNYDLCINSPLRRRVSYIDVTHKMYEDHYCVM